MEATAAAASTSADAGTGSASNGSSSSQSTTSNSTGETSTTQRAPVGAAPPSSTNDDPEFDFGEGRKAKRSQVIQDFNRVREAQQAADRRYAAAQKKLEAAEALRQHFDKLGIKVEDFEKDPNAVIQARARAYLQQQIEEARMSPEQVDARRREEALSEREARIKEAEDARTKSESDAKVTAQLDSYAADIQAALEQHQLAKTPANVARMAQLMLAAARNGVRLNSAQIAQLLTKSVGSERDQFRASLAENPQATAEYIKPYLSHFNGDVTAFMSVAPPEFIDAIRNSIVNAHESKFNNPQPQKPRAPSQPKIWASKDHPNGYISFDQMRERELQRK